MHYAILGIRRDASDSEIRAAYLAQIKVCHPDLSRDLGRAERILSVQRAYACLRDPELRALYDERIIASEIANYRKIRRARRRMRKLDRRETSNIVGRLRCITTMVIFASGTLAASAFYIASY